MSKRCNTCKQFLPEQVNFYIDKELDMKFKQKLPEKSCSTCKYSSRGVCNKEHDKWQPKEPEKKVDKLMEILDKYWLLGHKNKMVSENESKIKEEIAKAIYELFEKEVVPRKKEEIDTLLPQNSGATISQMAYAFNRCVDEIQENLSRMKGK